MAPRRRPDLPDRVQEPLSVGRRRGAKVNASIQDESSQNRIETRTRE